MDTRFLQTFLVVVERGSLAEAARVLNLTPAAVAQRMAALETEIGFSLLRRSGRTVQATPNAAAIIEHARSILSQVSDLRAVAALDQPVGKLRIGAISTVLSGILPSVMRRFFEHFPGIEVHIVPGSSLQLHDMVRDDHLDAAFLVEPPFDLSKIFTWHLMRSEPMIVLAPPGEESDDPFEVLRRHPFIRYDRKHWGGRIAETYLLEHGLRPRQQIELDSLEAIVLMVNEGIGASLVPEWAPPWPEGLLVRRLALPEPAPRRNVGLLWPSLSPRARLIERLIQVTGEPAHL